jgi:hypothetical protein
MGRGSQLSAGEPRRASAGQQHTAPGRDGICAQLGQPCYRDRRADSCQQCGRRRSGPHGPRHGCRWSQLGRAPAAALLPSAGADTPPHCRLADLRCKLCDVSVGVRPLRSCARLVLFNARALRHKLTWLFELILCAGAVVCWPRMCDGRAAEGDQGAAHL